MTVMGLSDEAVGILLPFVCYWSYSGLYELAGGFLLKYRLYPREVEDEKNLVTRWEAVKGVLFNQAFQLTLSLSFLWYQGGRIGGAAVQPPVHVQLVQAAVAVVVLDAWLYFGHRLLHTNRFLYKHVHASHHHIVVPYAFAAQYQHPLNALFLETIGVVLAAGVSGMTPRTLGVFVSLAAMKAIDDHCGLWLPGHPFHLVFSCNSAVHTIHHQHYGENSNFSTTYFTFWDWVMGTYMPYTLEEKDGGGYQLKVPLKAAAPVKKED